MVTIQTVQLYSEDAQLDYDTFLKEVNSREWKEQTVCDRCMKGLELP